MRAVLLSITTVAAMALATPAAAETFYDEARVLDAQPVYAPRDVPVRVQQCGYEPPAPPPRVDPAVLGDARTVDPGASLPGTLRRDVELRDPPADVYRCRMVTRMESQNELAGYRVRYEYGGRVYERRVAERPGDTIRVRVRISAGRSELVTRQGWKSAYATTDWRPANR